MGRFLKVLLGIIVLITGVWYFLIKDEHYQITFSSKQPPGVIYNHIMGWNKYATRDIDSVSIKSLNPYAEIEQEVHIGDSLFSYRWEFEKNASGNTEVSVGIKDLNNGIVQKLQAPFSSNDFVKRSIKSVKDVGSELNILTKKFKVHSIKDTLIVGDFCAYIPLESNANMKARTMLYNITTIMGYINENEITLKGDPFLEVTNWNRETNTIKYNFCFPIEKKENLPYSSEIKFKTTESFKGLKAEFNGNYSISNNAWFYLMDYANSNGLNVKKEPVEFYLDDPHIGGDPILWKALILLPLED
ncbi:MAG: hypothetical protein HKN48_13020 [Flavobacteriaceae bacterium]|nr:hypothetical protein [Flavobacteriaceae bacterium]